MEETGLGRKYEDWFVSGRCSLPITVRRKWSERDSWQEHCVEYSSRVEKDRSTCWRCWVWMTRCIRWLWQKVFIGVFSKEYCHVLWRAFEVDCERKKGRPKLPWKKQVDEGWFENGRCTLLIKVLALMRFPLGWSVSGFLHLLAVLLDFRHWSLLLWTCQDLILWFLFCYETPNWLF